MNNGRSITKERAEELTAKHTPGPWSITEMDNTDLSISGSYERGKHGGKVADLIATVSCGLNTTQQANAHLIAAAPELLNACVRMMVGITKRDSHNCEWYEGIEVDGAEEARAAIAKAEGEQ